MSLEIYTKVIFLVGISFTGFGLFAYTRDPKKISNQLFGLLSISFAVWSFSWFLMLVFSENDSTALVWAKALSLGAIWIPILYVHWLFSLLGIHRHRKIILSVGYLNAALFSVLNFTPQFISGVHPIFFFPVWPEPGTLYKWYIILGYFILVTYALIEVYRRFSHLTRAERFQLLYVLVGSVLGFGGGATNFLAMYNLTFVRPFGLFVGALGVMASPYFFAYSSLRYNLMNVKIIFSEAFGALLILILLARTITATTTADLIFNVIVLSVVTWITYLLVRSVIKEVEQREKIESLAFQLAAANKELKQLDVAKSEFISIASHQLRAPLTIIKGYVSMFLEGSLGAITTATREAMQKVAISAEQLVKLISDLLDLSRIEAGKMSYEFREVALDEITAEVLKQFAEQAKSKGLELSYRKDATARLVVRADHDKLREVVTNLVDNALKYTSRGRVMVTVSAEEREAEPWVILKVEDSGMGFSPEDGRHLFTKFARSEEARKVRADGMGLGLYVVKRIIEDHGGRVSAESRGAGQGSTFVVELPPSGRDQKA